MLINLDFPGFARHQITLESSSTRGVYEVQTLHRDTTTHSLYAWLKKFGEPNPQTSDKIDLSKKAAKYFANNPE